MKKEFKKVIQISILVALACVFSLIDRLISNAILGLFPAVAAIVPSFKIGLANIVILFILYKYEIRYALTAVILKSVLLGFIYGSLVTFVIGFFGTVLSFSIMLFMVKIFKNTNLVVLISTVGGFFNVV